jgi:hypothetical protein
MTHPIVTTATVAAAAAVAEVQTAADLLAEAMRKIHGGSWRVQVEHESTFVMVAQIGDKSRVKPKPESA